MVGLQILRLMAGAVAARTPASAPVVPVIVDINSAPIPQLCALPGIGPNRAAQIVLRRVRHGPFRSVQELVAVDGLGPGTVARLAAYAIAR